MTETTIYPLSTTLKRLIQSEAFAGIALISCTIISLILANSSLSSHYLAFWQTTVAGLSIEHWINDALMAIFFLLIGLELERELYTGELSSLKNALLPIFAALGGMAAPALIHFFFNAGSATQSGIGIPMATDIAFALGILTLLGSRIPTSLKILVTAFAIIDDLGAIIIIAIFYTAKISLIYLIAAFVLWGGLIALNRIGRIMTLTPYLLGGAIMWFLMLKSGVHATIAGIMLAFAIPFTAKASTQSTAQASTQLREQQSPSYRLEHFLHMPVAFFVLPLFALANTAIPISTDWYQQLSSHNSLGIIAGLVIGKPLGVALCCAAAIAMGICRLPEDLNWRHIVGAGCLGGIGFTMSIFITNLAFIGDINLINASKMAILVASLSAGILGFLWLALLKKSPAAEI